MRRFFSYSKIAMWLGLLVVVYMLMLLLNQGSKNYELQKRTDKLALEIEQLKNDNQQLGYKIIYYKTDSYKEKLAREKLGLQMPGESILIVPDKDNKSTDVAKTIPLEGDSAISSSSNFEQWLEFLFGS